MRSRRLRPSRSPRGLPPAGRLGNNREIFRRRDTGRGRRPARFVASASRVPAEKSILADDAAASSPMIRKLWLTFCQTATVCVAALFVVMTLRPDLLAWSGRGNVVTIREAPPEPEVRRVSSFSDAAKRAMPAVVNIFTTKEMKMQRHPFMDDPVFRHFFGEQFDAQT